MLLGMEESVERVYLDRLMQNGMMLALVMYNITNQDKVTLGGWTMFNNIIHANGRKVETYSVTLEISNCFQCQHISSTINSNC
jgi:hypothetical protein